MATLPTEFSALLKHFESRKRSNKSHSGGVDKKKTKSAKPCGRSRGSDIWNETEDYFRVLTSPDTDTLSDVASVSSLAATKSLLLQHFESNHRRDNAEDPACADDGGAVNGDGKESIRLDSLEEEQVRSVSGSCSDSVEWLLGCRDKIYMTTERPSKKRSF